MKHKPIDKSDRLIILLSGMIGLFLFIFLFNLALQYGSPVDVSIILTTPPVMVVIISSILFKTKISGLKAIGLILSLGGALMLVLIGGSHHGSSRSMTGNIFAFLCCLCYAFYLISLKNIASKYHPVTLLRWVFLAACVGAIPLGFLDLGKSELVLHPDISAILMVAFVIIFPSFLSYLLMPPAIKRIGHELVSMYQYLIPVIATTIAVVTKMDKLYWDQPVAVLIIFVGVYLSAKAVNKEQGTKPKSD